VEYRPTGLVARQTRQAVGEKSILPAPEDVLLVPVRRFSSTVPRPSAVSSTIWARQTCLCGLFRFVTMAGRDRRSASSGMILMILRNRQTRMRKYPAESKIGWTR
jgi:hypothetical protein